MKIRTKSYYKDNGLKAWYIEITEITKEDISTLDKAWARLERRDHRVIKFGMSKGNPVYVDFYVSDPYTDVDENDIDEVIDKFIEEIRRVKQIEEKEYEYDI